MNANGLIWLFLFLIFAVGVHGQSQSKILMVLSNAEYYGDTKIKTANHYEELIIPYDLFIKAGYEVDLVSPEGGSVPLGYIRYAHVTDHNYLYDQDFMDKLKNTIPSKDVIASEYVAIFYCGGGAAMYDVPYDKHLLAIAEEIHENNQGIVAAICHGTAGITQIKIKDDYLIKNKKLCGFPDAFENRESEYYESFPFSIDEEVNAHGGLFSYSKEGWDGYVVKDGRLMTAQDPSGAEALAHLIIKRLNKK